MLSDFFPPISQPVWLSHYSTLLPRETETPPRWTGRLSPESALLVNSCFPSPEPPESATAVPFSSLKGLWNGVAAWCLVVSETPAWSLRLTSLMCTCAHIHVTLRCTHTCALGGFSPVSESCIGPWALGPDMLSIFLHLGCSFWLFSGQPTPSLLGLLIAALP